MSYKLGFVAFCKRIEKRFPSSEFLWKKKVINWSVSPRDKGGFNPIYKDEVKVIASPCMFICGDFSSFKDDIQIKIFTKSGLEIADIYAKLAFGISLSIRSKFLDSNGRHVYRRPVNISFANRHKMRRRLQNKPKFAQLGAKIAREMRYNYDKEIALPSLDVAS